MGGRLAAVVALAGFIALAAMIWPAHRGAAENAFGDPNAEPTPFNPQMSALTIRMHSSRRAAPNRSTARSGNPLGVRAAPRDGAPGQEAAARLQSSGVNTLMTQCNFTRCALLRGGIRDSGYVLLQQIDRCGKQNHILHQEGNIAGHSREPACSRVPAIGHERDDRDRGDEGDARAERPEDA